jgi:signal transduction histidine kinase
VPVSFSQLAGPSRPKWFHVTVSVGLIIVAVALTVGWQILGVEGSQVAQDAGRLRWVVYLFGTILFLLLIGGLGLLVTLLLREVQLNERQSNFISAVTHELKTPVASLQLYLDTLQLRDLNDDRREEFYRTMRRDLDRLHTTIDDVLNAAVYSHRAPLELKPFDIAVLVRHAIGLTGERNQLPEGAIEYDGPESLELRGDAIALEVAVLNLLDNAVKYSRDRVHVEVSLTTARSGKAQLTVRDQGIGMSRTHLRFIFNRFYRIGAEVRRSRPGTGLGLFIVRTVVRKHRGSVTCESPGPDRGSTFTVTLPGADRTAA